jgi:hypothetical protein
MINGYTRLPMIFIILNGKIEYSEENSYEADYTNCLL